MFNLSDLTKGYIATNYLPDLLPAIVQGFTLLEEFNVDFYEDKYVDLIESDSFLDKDTIRDGMLNLLKKDLYSIIQAHEIRLSDDAPPSLVELVEVCNFLYRIQRLEDYSLPAYILSGSRSDRWMLVDLIAEYTLLSKPRILDMLETVSETFMEGLRKFIHDKSEERSPAEIDRVRREYIRYFFQYTENVESLGKRLYRQGYTNVTLEELSHLYPGSFADYIDDLLLKNPSQAAFDTMSLLIVTKDQYDAPVFKFAKQNGLLTNHPDHITKLNGLLIKMMKDFNDYLEAQKKATALYGN